MTIYGDIKDIPECCEKCNCYETNYSESYCILTKDVTKRLYRYRESRMDGCPYEPLIFCKDCNFWKNKNWCIAFDVPVNNPNFYCADGVLKNESN